ncbi:MAG: hypothetical protein PVH29_08155 [Candidatus Zixiibacteriota bacterium]
MAVIKSKHVEFEVFVTLRVIDRVALTARQALTDRLGYGAVLADLKRRDYYRVAVAGDEDESLEYVRKVAEASNLFANPNKETYTVGPINRPLSRDARFVALVYPREGLYDEALCTHVSLDLGYDRVVAAGRGVAWTLDLSPGSDEKYVEEILVTSERGKGLLLNPHAEQYEII